MLTRPPTLDREKESGSIVMAMLVMMIIALLGSTILLQSLSELEAADRSTESTSSAGGAEVGVADAIARIRAGETTSFKGSGSLDVGTYSYRATQVDKLSFVIYAEATVGESTQAIEVAIEADEIVAVGDPLVRTFTGILSDDNQGSIEGSVATAGQIRFIGNPPGTTQILMGSGASCDDCPNVVRQATVPERPEPRLPADHEDRLCWAPTARTTNAGGGWPKHCVRHPYDYEPYVYIREQLDIINGPLIIYVEGALWVDLRTSTINKGGDPENFQMYVWESSYYPYMWLDGADITGIIYAPRRSISVRNLTFTGSMNVDALEISTGGTVNIRGTSTTTGTGEPTNWTVTSWQQVPVRS